MNIQSAEEGAGVLSRDCFPSIRRQIIIYLIKMILKCLLRHSRNATAPTHMRAS